jgi:uncharacterized protein YjaG (DUF416 family)
MTEQERAEVYMIAATKALRAMWQQLHKQADEIHEELTISVRLLEQIRGGDVRAIEQITDAMNDESHEEDQQ